MSKWLVKTFIIPALVILTIAGSLIYGNNTIKISRFLISMDKLPGAMRDCGSSISATCTGSSSGSKTCAWPGRSPGWSPILYLFPGI